MNWFEQFKARKTVTNPKQRNKVAVYGENCELLAIGDYVPNKDPELKIIENGVSFYAVLIDALGCPRALLRLTGSVLYKGDTFILSPPEDLEKMIYDTQKS